MRLWCRCVFDQGDDAKKGQIDGAAEPESLRMARQVPSFGLMGSSFWARLVFKRVESTVWALSAKCGS